LCRAAIVPWRNDSRFLSLRPVGWGDMNTTSQAILAFRLARRPMFGHERVFHSSRWFPSSGIREWADASTTLYMGII
jgi:hypothetical protein